MELLTGLADQRYRRQSEHSRKRTDSRQMVVSERRHGADCSDYRKNICNEALERKIRNPLKLKGLRIFNYLSRHGVYGT